MQQASGEHPYDLAIIGSGGAAFAAAIAARRKDRRVVLVERGRIGGTCVIAGVFADEGIAVHTGAQLAHVARDPGGPEVVATVHDSDGRARELRAEGLLVAAGRRPVTDGLGLEAVGVKVGERGQVVVDERLRTHNPRIWAAGDVTGAPQFVYVAAAHGTLVADNALDGAGRTLDYRHLPRVIFTSPQLAAVGLTDQQVVQRGIACACRVLPLDQVPRALVDRDTRGLVKIVAERASGRVLGVTMGEGLKLAAQAFTRDITKLSCCAA